MMKISGLWGLLYADFMASKCLPLAITSMNSLKILSWNARGIKRQTGMLHELFKNYDLICIQET